MLEILFLVLLFSWVIGYIFLGLGPLIHVLLVICAIGIFVRVYTSDESGLSTRAR